MTQSNLSIYIIGGGPAGCATALALHQQALNSRHELHITLCDAPNKSAPAIGETVPPMLTQYLNELNIASILETTDHLICPGSISKWQDDTPGYNDFFFTPVGNGFHLNRTTFNAQLQDACRERKIKVINDTRLSEVRIQQQKLELTLKTDGKQKQHYCDFVVDASGHSRSVTNRLNIAQNNLDHVVSICAFYDLKGTPKNAAHTLVSSAEKGWWYGTRLPDDKALVSLCTDTKALKENNFNSIENWYQYFSTTDWFYQQCCKQFGGLLGVPEEIHLRPSSSSILSNVVGQNWLAVGDAASSYDSISSAGITKSVYHGIKAGHALANLIWTGSNKALSNYQETVFSDFNQYLQQHQMHYHAGGGKFNHKGFWGRRLLA
ncbi:MAG: NAD(P)/FAD-dependent oxidoreductase [Aestuariibacter sp.]